MRRVTSATLGLAVALAAGSAFAQDEGGGATATADTSNPPDAGGKVKLGLRLGYGLPMGDYAKDSSLSDDISGQIPIWLDAGYMVTPNVMLGLYGQYGIVMIKDQETGKSGGCPKNVDCSASDIRIGLQGQYHLSPGESLNPWFGLGVGYEILGMSVSAGGNDSSASNKGLEFANLQGGADFEVGEGFGVGPFVSFSLGQYSSVSYDPDPLDASGDIKDKAMHEWLVLGVRGMLGL